MSPFVRKAPSRLASILVGLGLVALAMAWSTAHRLPTSIIVDGKSHSFGTTARGDYQRHSWEIRNGGALPLKLRTRFTSGRCGFSLWLGVDQIIPAGGLLTVSLSCPTSDLGGIPYTGFADIATDDPQSPWVRFRVIGITERDRFP